MRSLPPESCRRIAVVATLALHACALLGVFALRSTAVAKVAQPKPIAVHWIEPPRSEPPKAVPVAPPPRLARRATPKPPPPKVVQPRSEPRLAAVEAPPVVDAPVVAPPPPAPPVPAVEPTPLAAPATPATKAAPAPAPVSPPPVSPPRFDAAYLQNPPPSYPPRSRRMGETGRVVLRVLVTAAGLPERVELRTSSGSQRLDGAALQAVQHWKFVPARQGETPVSAWVLVPILFTLEG